MRRALIAALLATGLFAFPHVSAVATPQATSASGIPCGRADAPETGIQGDVPRVDQLDGRANHGYNCGVDVVGHSDLGGRVGNANMAWAGHCAYIASAGSGVAVVDVSDPKHPRQTATLHGGGSDFTLETIAATEVGGRAVLVAGRYGLLPLPLAAPMDIYDLHGDCAHPQYRSTLTFPGNIHNLTFSPDGRRLYTTLPLQVADLSDLSHPRYLGNLDNQIPQAGAVLGKYLAHEVMTSPDGRLLYLGGQTPMYQTFTIVDISGWPAHPPKVLSQVFGRGHDIRLATIKGRTYALHSEESVVEPTAKGCVDPTLNPVGGASQPWLSDVTDPRHPIMRVSQFRLAINEPSNCLTAVLDQVSGSVHYHDVDNPAHTTFAMLSMWNSGLRIADLRDPLHPREAAYFNPGAYSTIAGGTVLDQAWSHVRYLPASGQIWFTTLTGGFWVLELEPQVRAALGLPAVHSAHPSGTPARAASSVHQVVATQVTPWRYSCIIGLGSATTPSR
jgi:hypothetical protein